MAKERDKNTEIKEIKERSEEWREKIMIVWKKLNEIGTKGKKNK